MDIKLIIWLCMVVSFNSYGAKKECAELLKKLQNIQSQQKQGQSIKSSQSLREREDVARKKWWDCENNKTLSANKKKKAPKNKKQAATTTYVSQKEPLKVFSSNREVVIKGRFSGEKQLHWLEYYQRPKKCAKPKTTQVFAYCMENKTEQQNKFEQTYQNNNE